MQGFLDELLDAARFSDYCPNGLQVEGKPRIARVVSGVTASAALIRAAAKAGADALLVLQRGRLGFSGTPAELLAQTGGADLEQAYLRFNRRP